MTGPRSPRRAGRAVAVVAGVLLVGFVVLELGGRMMVQRVAADALRDQGVEDARVQIGSVAWRPVVVPALWGSGVDRVLVELRDGEVSGVRVAEAEYVLDDVDVEVDPFGSSVRVNSIDSGRFRMLVAPESVGELLGVPARIDDGRLTVGPDDEPAKVRIEGARLVVESPYLQRERIDPRLLLLDGRLLPCEPEVTVVGDAIELRCEGDQLPGILAGRLGEPIADLPAPTELQPPATIERDAADAAVGQEEGG
jgi:hypothetical protein